LGNPAYIDDGREKKSRTTGFPRSGLVHMGIIAMNLWGGHSRSRL
jgi:hypothetical protein